MVNVLQMVSSTACIAMHLNTQSTYDWHSALKHEVLENARLHIRPRRKRSQRCTLYCLRKDGRQRAVERRRAQVKDAQRYLRYVKYETGACGPAFNMRWGPSITKAQ